MNISHNKIRQIQQGFVLPMAIFLLVVLAGLGAYAANLSILTSASTIQDIVSTRAYFAARGGLEWAAMRVIAPGTTTMANCPTDAMPLTMNGFNVTVTCNAYSYTVAGGDQSVSVYEITSVASSGGAGSANYVERKMNVTLSRCLQGTVACNG